VIGALGNQGSMAGLGAAASQSTGDAEPEESEERAAVDT
jgi:hypothetical protein